MAIKVLTITIGNHHWASIEIKGVIKKKLDFSFINTENKQYMTWVIVKSFFKLKTY